MKGKYMRKLLILLLIFIFNGCSSKDYNNLAEINNQNDKIGTEITVRPDVVVERAYEKPKISKSLQKKLNNIHFSSTSFLKGNENCVGLIRLNISGSIDYFQLIETLKKRAHDIGGNAIGIFDYKESRRVLINQESYEVYDEKKGVFQEPLIKYVLVKNKKKLAKITADIFRCKKST